MKRGAPLLLLLALSAHAAPVAPISVGEFRSRRAALATRIGEGTVLLFAAPAGDVGDTRPDPDLFWTTGLAEPGAAVCLSVDHPSATARSRQARELSDRLDGIAGELRRRAARLLADGDAAGAGRALDSARDARAAADRAEGLANEGAGPARISTRLYLPAPDPVRRRWRGPYLAAGPEALAATGADEVRDSGKLAADLPSLAPPGGRLWLPAPARIPERLRARVDRLRAGRTVRDVASAIAGLRAVKSPGEIARIRRACELTADGLVAAMRRCRPGRFEYELMAVLEYTCRSGGAARQSFPSIVGSGPNATILHYAANRRRIRPGELVLMDVGAEYEGYAADVTRTFPADGRFTAGQAEVYDIVLRAQRAGIAAVRPGATLAVVDRAARAVIREAGYARAFPHAVGHFVGLEVHDPAPGGPLAPGMVITVEPGVYLPEQDLGVRIEDTILVTRDGAEVLSSGVPKDREAITKLVQSGDRDR